MPAPGSVNRPVLASVEHLDVFRHPDFEVVPLVGRIRIGRQHDHILRERIRLEAIEHLEQQRRIESTHLRPTV